MNEPLLPSPEWLSSRLRTRWAGRGEIDYAPELPSTNARLKEMARSGAPAGSVSVCDFQSAGRGRLQRQWTTSAGESLPVSLLLKPRLAAEELPLCTLAAALAAAEAVEAVCPSLRPGIKWPNDVVLDGRKCVGILCEGATDPEGRFCVVVGAGFNVNQLVFPEELRSVAVSLWTESRKQNEEAPPVSLRELLLAFLAAAERVADEGEKNGFSSLLPVYRERCVTLGRRVRVTGPAESYEGYAQAVNDAGELLVRDDGGALRAVRCGDVSVRSQTGYA